VTARRRISGCKRRGGWGGKGTKRIRLMLTQSAVRLPKGEEK
jgi:hypothetical protein